MHLNRVRLNVLVVVMSLVPVGCRRTATPAANDLARTSTGDTVREAEADEIREVVFRDLLERRPEGEICFISFGRKDGEWVDAPDTFLRRLADLKAPLGKPSQARFPAFAEKEPDGRRYTPIRDRATGREASIYYVKITRWLSDTKVEVEAGRIGGPLDGGGYDAEVRKENGRWVLDRWPNGTFRGWVS